MIVLVNAMLAEEYTNRGQRRFAIMALLTTFATSSSACVDVCVVGAGLSGAVIAERYATQKHKSVLVLEKRDHIGGNCYDYIDKDTGIRVNLYGAHLFHTRYTRVWDYIRKFSEWVPYEHRVLARVDNKYVPVPVNIDTVNTLFGTDIQTEEQMDNWLSNEQVPFPTPQNSKQTALSRVGPRLYNLLFKPYTIKQWDKPPEKLGPEVLERIPVRNNHDPRYFSDPHQALPKNGYTAVFENMFNHPLITVRTGTDYFAVRGTLCCARTYFTGPIDAYFAHLGWPKLEYRSLDFKRKVVRNTGYVQPNSVVNYPSPRVNFTRIVEYKHILNQSSPHTVLFYEHSKEGGDPYYPVPNAENRALYARYQAMAAKEPNVTFVGRLANYKYFNMDQTIKNALELFDRDTQTDQHSADALPCVLRQGSNAFVVGSVDEERCYTLASRKIGSMKSLNKLRAVLDVARRAAPLLSGDFVEAGVAEGGGSLAVLFYLACSGHLGAREFHLFDTWEGIPPPKTEQDKGFRKGQWHVAMNAFRSNVDKWGEYYREHPSPFYSWGEAKARLKTHVGLFAATMPAVLAPRPIAALYCDGDMYQSSLDCLRAAGPRLQDQAWVYHDDYFTFTGNYQAVNDWISQGTHSHAGMHLVPQRGAWRTITDLSDCKPPKDNSGASGSCGGTLTEACFWQVRGGGTGAPACIRDTQTDQRTQRQLIYEAYKDHIDTKIKARPVYGVPCKHHPLFTGEFGYELQGIVPWYYNEHVTAQCDLAVEGVQGTRYIYWFASSFKEISAKRRSGPLPLDGPLGRSVHVRSIPGSGWTMPPWQNFFGKRLDTESLFSTTKPVVVLFNKYTKEWGGRPVNYLRLKTLHHLLSLLVPSHHVVYVRMQFAKLQDSENDEFLPFADKKMIRKMHPSVTLFEDVFDSSTMDYNLLLFGIAAKASLFISIQGGVSVVASLWGTPNFIYAIRGSELKVDAYRNVYGRFGGSTIWATKSQDDLIAHVGHYIGAS